MSDWATPAATAGNAEWGDGGGFQHAADEFQSTTGDDAAGFDATSAHGGGNGGDRACYNCGQEGHNKAECPNPRVMKCRHCGEEGHMIRDCPTAPPREFTGECRHCKKEGHMAKDCPDKPPMVCSNCQQEGHTVAECKSARKIDRSGYAEVDGEVAWAKIKDGASQQNFDIVKQGIQEYLRAAPDVTYASLEKAFRAQDIDLYLVALENPSLLITHTHMDMQGNLGKKYRVHFHWNNKPRRPREIKLWPKSPEENLERLEDAGETVERGLPRCSNCDEIGHTTKRCPREKVEKQRVVIMCYNCEQEGHRIRDCPQPRKDKFSCRNCGQGGHKAADCPEPRRPRDDVECRKCGETGHFAKDCPQGGDDRSRACYNCGEEGHNSKDCPNPKKIQCRNCDEFGHMSKECPKPRDWSRVKCNNCGEMGHTHVRCTKPSSFNDAADEAAGVGVVGPDDGPSFELPPDNFSNQVNVTTDAGDDAWGVGGGDIPKVGSNTFLASNSDW